MEDTLGRLYKNLFGTEDSIPMWYYVNRGLEVSIGPCGSYKDPLLYIGDPDFRKLGTGTVSLFRSYGMETLETLPNLGLKREIGILPDRISYPGTILELTGDATYTLIPVGLDVDDNGDEVWIKPDTEVWYKSLNNLAVMPIIIMDDVMAIHNCTLQSNIKNASEVKIFTEGGVVVLVFLRNGETQTYAEERKIPSKTTIKREMPTVEVRSKYEMDESDIYGLYIRPTEDAGKLGKHLGNLTGAYTYYKIVHGGQLYEKGKKVKIKL